jgi:hypothetical protein
MKKNKLTAIKLLLLAQTLAILIYTYLAVRNEGWGLLDQVTKNLLEMGWNGQFNLDFASYLLLSAVWILWRNAYSASSFILALMAATIGILFFAPYLLFLLSKEGGDLKRVLTGKH